MKAAQRNVCAEMQKIRFLVYCRVIRWGAMRWGNVTGAEELEVVKTVPFM